MNRHFLVCVALAASVAACAKDSKPADSGLSQDLTLASQTQAPTPTLNDTALAPEPVPQPRAVERAPQRLPQNPTVRSTPPAIQPQPQPQPQPQAPTIAPAPVRAAAEPVVTAPAGGSAPALKEVGAGTPMTVASGSRICTNTNRPGDKIVATLASAVMGSNGAMIPAGSTVVLEIASVTPGDTPEAAQITFRVRSVMINDVSHSVTGSVTPLGAFEQQKIASPPGDDKKKVIGGAIAGAIAGKILGGSTKATVVGAAAGAATGAVVAKAGQKYETCMAEGAQMRIVLSERIVLGG
jgi:hypothetical protein